MKNNHTILMLGLFTVFCSSFAILFVFTESKMLAVYLTIFQACIIACCLALIMTDKYEQVIEESEHNDHHDNEQDYYREIL